MFQSEILKYRKILKIYINLCTLNALIFMSLKSYNFNFFLDFFSYFKILK